MLVTALRSVHVAERRGRRSASNTRSNSGCCFDRVRDGFAGLDAGEIDAFELDELIHRYKRSARELWKLWGSSGSGWERAVGTLEYLRGQGEELPDWWAAGGRAGTAEDHTTRSGQGGGSSV
jgi:hypothetical protein